MKHIPFPLKTSLVFALACLPALAHADMPAAVNDPMFGKLATDPDLKEDSTGKWQGSLGAGLTVRRGSSNSTEGSLSLDAAREMRNSRLTANALGVRSSKDGERNGDMAHGEFRGERRVNNDLFGFAGIGGERDAMQDMTMRASVSTGIGTRWIDNDTAKFNVYGGLAYSMERYSNGDSPKGVEVLLGTELRFNLSDTSRITHRLVVYPDSVGGGARFAMQGDLTTRINEHFGLQLSVLQKYREKVLQDNSHLDTVFFTGITAGF